MDFNCKILNKCGVKTIFIIAKPQDATTPHGFYKSSLTTIKMKCYTKIARCFHCTPTLADFYSAFELVSNTKMVWK